MTRARWWAIGILSVVTVLVVALDATGLILGEAEPAQPQPLSLPSPLDAVDSLPDAVEPTTEAPDSAVVRHVDQLLRDRALGSSVHAVVAPLADPNDIWTEIRPDAAATPASTLKLWTAAATLDAFPPQHRLTTSVVWDAAREHLVLIGGGDATLQSDPSKASGYASLKDLADQVTRALKRPSAPIDAVTLDFDTSLFSGPAVSPDWEPTYVTSGVIAPVTALMVDQGMVSPPLLSRYPDPAGAAAKSFADLLRDRGLDVRSRQSSVDASDVAPGAEPIAEVVSPPVIDLVEQMLRNSDNQLAEALGRLAAGEDGDPRTFKGAAAAIERSAEQRGADMSNAEVLDASGLSRDDRLTAENLVDALHFASSEPQLAPILSGLAVAGFDGTLTDRFSRGMATSAAGVVRAKTGTLTGISAEAGVATTCDGDLVSYAFVADAVADTEAARSVLDDAAAALAACH